MSSETLHTGKIFALRKDDVRMPGGKIVTREVVEHYGAVAIVAIDDDGRIPMVYQYRHPFGRRLWELPAGKLDEGEKPLQAAKRELIESLPPAGIAVLNADDPRVLAFRAAHGGRTVTYGFSDGADLRATELEISAEGAAFRVCGVKFQTTLSGRHAVSNILAGLAVAKLFDIELGELVESVARLTPGEMRGGRSRWHGVTILNDSYNSNPEAARNMIDVLRQEPAERRIAVLGEMLELGRLAESLHRELGNYIANAGVDVLVGVSGVSRFMVEEAIRVGMTHAAFFFENSDQAGQFLREFVRPGDAILFKGSRGVHVERVLAALKM